VGGLIERVASEFNQLQFYVTQCKQAPFLDKIKPRIITITTTLQEALEQSFRTGIETNDAEVLRQCLRTYSIIDKIDDVEALFRDLVVVPFAAESLTKDRASGLTLDAIYAEIIQFVEDKCLAPCAIAREMNITGCDFLVNSVWPELSEALAKLSFIFASGIPDEFHKHFVTTESFFTEFEKRCGTRTSVKRLREHPTYVTFRKRWSLPVYFQLRFQEIAGTFETKLADPIADQKQDVGGAWRLSSSALLVELVQRCWSTEVYLPGLSHRFWKLTLQLLARYGAWMSAQGNSSTPLTIDETLLLMQDGAAIKAHTATLLATTVKTCVGSQVDEVGLQGALDDACTMLDGAVDAVKSGSIGALSTQCETILRACVAIPKQYRHTKKAMSGSPSDYVTKVLAPVKSFVTANGAALPNVAQDWAVPVCCKVTERFEGYATDLLAAEEKMEKQLSALKKIKSKKAKAKAGDVGMTDQEKIRLQLWQDVVAYTAELESTGISSADVPALQRLRALVDVAKPADPAM
jgi:hypothetical protein